MMSLHDVLYGMLMVGANNMAIALANNMGSYLRKMQGKEGYFSCFDLEREYREHNVSAFMARMKKVCQ